MGYLATLDSFRHSPTVALVRDGADAAFVRRYLLQAAAGAYALTGADISTAYSGAAHYLPARRTVRVPARPFARVPARPDAVVPRALKGRPS